MNTYSQRPWTLLHYPNGHFSHGIHADFWLIEGPGVRTLNRGDAHLIVAAPALLEALKQIAATDSRYGVQMQETAAAAVLKFLESQVTT